MSSILGILGALLIGFVACIIILSVATTITAFVVWRTIGNRLREAAANIDWDNMRNFQGEIIPGTATYQSKEPSSEKPKRHVTIGDDGELVHVEYFDDDDSEISTTQIL